MRIAFISYEFPPDTGKGGIGTYVQQIAQAMALSGMDVQVFAGSPHRTISETINGYLVHWVQCNSAEDYRINVVDRFLIEHTAKPFDCMESPEIGGNAREIKKRLPQLPLIVRLHAPNYLVEHLKKHYVSFSAKLRFVLGAVKRLRWDLGYWRKYQPATDPDFQFIQLANYITAPSDAMKQWVVKHWQITPEKIVVLPNIFAPAATWLQIPINKDLTHKRIVFFGRLNVLKGLVNATNAVKRLLKEFPDWQFRVIGNDGFGPSGHGSMKAWMQQELAAVMQQVEFVDGLQYEDLPTSVAPAEIVLLPSLFESFSYTCAEAMAVGKAIVGSANGGMADLLVHNQSGLLIDPLNEKAIYSSLKKLIMDNGLRYEFSIRARERILTQFNADKACGQFVVYYQSMVNNALV